MSTSPTENPGPGVVLFTARGDAALDHLVASLAAECDGSPTSIADLLEGVLEADVEDLAESLSEAARPLVRDSRPSRDVEEVGPAAESPDGAARRRLAARAPLAGDAANAPGNGITR
jgi:hypothetical protein